MGSKNPQELDVLSYLASIAGRPSKFLKSSPVAKTSHKTRPTKPIFLTCERNEETKCSDLVVVLFETWLPGYPGTLKLTARTCITEVVERIYGYFWGPASPGRCELGQVLLPDRFLGILKHQSTIWSRNLENEKSGTRILRTRNL